MASMPDRDATIADWIDAYQRGKAGIYPWQVTLLVCAEFGVPVAEASEHVARHMRRVLAEVCGKQSQNT